MKTLVKLVSLILLVVCVLIGLAWFWFSTREMTLDEARELVQQKEEELIALSVDHAAIFESPEVVEEQTTKDKTHSKIFARDTPIETPTGPAIHRKIGRIEVDLKSRRAVVSVTEYPRPTGKAWSDSEGRPRGSGIPPAADAAPRIGGTIQSTLPTAPGGTNVVVLTNLTRLKEKHPSAFSGLKQYLESCGPILDLAEEQDRFPARKKLRELLRKRGGSLFIFGGNDVVPFVTRPNPCFGGKDLDQIYGDDWWADLDGDELWLPDVDCGRIPDRPEIISNPDSSLRRSSDAVQPLQNQKFSCVANFRRQMSDDVIAVAGSVREGRNLFWSIPHTNASIQPGFYEDENLYLILHGGSKLKEGFYYTGEPEDRNLRPWPRAFTTDMVRRAGLIISGACYGGQIVGREVDTSICLSFLANGCVGFIGHSGSSYSGAGDDFNSAEALFARMVIDHLKDGWHPATAFRKTKLSYAEQATCPSERKMLFQTIYYGLPPLAKIKKPRKKESKPADAADMEPATTEARFPRVFSEGFDKGKADASIWKKGGSSGPGWKVEPGRLAVESIQGKEGATVILSTEGELAFKGDWTLSVRLSTAFGKGGGRWSLHFQMMLPDGKSWAEQALLFDGETESWSLYHGISGSDHHRIPMPAGRRSGVLTMAKEGDTVQWLLDGAPIHRSTISSSVHDGSILRILTMQERTARTRTFIDFIHLFGELTRAPKALPSSDSKSEGTSESFDVTSAALRCLKEFRTSLEQSDVDGMARLFASDVDWRDPEQGDARLSAGDTGARLLGHVFGTQRPLALRSPNPKILRVEELSKGKWSLWVEGEVSSYLRDVDDNGYMAGRKVPPPPTTVPWICGLEVVRKGKDVIISALETPVKPFYQAVYRPHVDEVMRGKDFRSSSDEQAAFRKRYEQFLGKWKEGKAASKKRGDEKVLSKKTADQLVEDYEAR